MVKKKDIDYKTNTAIYRAFTVAAARFNKEMSSRLQGFVTGTHDYTSPFQVISGQDLLEANKRKPKSITDRRPYPAATRTGESINSGLVKFMLGMYRAGYLLSSGHGTYYVHIGNVLDAWKWADAQKISRDDFINNSAHRNWLIAKREGAGK